MRGFLVSTMAPVLWIMTVFDAFSIFMMFRRARKGHASTISILTGILCLGLFYDSLILASGCLLQYGTIFSLLSQLRYILHCTLIPLLFPICAYSLTVLRAGKAHYFSAGMKGGFHFENTIMSCISVHGII